MEYLKTEIMEEEIGIDLLLDLATDGVAVLKKYSKAKEDDGKVSKLEAIAMLPKVGAFAKDFLKSKELFAQAKDIDTEEGKQLLDHIISLGVVSDKAQIVAVNLMEIIEGEVAIWNNNVIPIINVFKK